MLGALGVTIVAAAGCAGSDGAPDRFSQDGGEGRVESAAATGRLSPRLGSVPRNGRLLAPGVHELRIGEGRPAFLSVPPGVARGRPVPLIVVLHGAGGSARSGLGLLREITDDAGVALLAPSSRGRTWDVLLGAYGPDVTVLDALLGRVSSELVVDTSRIVVAGFSDGASYALSLGLTNGDLFSGVVAFSPGFCAATNRRGRPLVYQSHGVDDDVLPIDRTSRRLVPALRRKGYRVAYREFAGGHVVPPDIAREALGQVLAE